MLPYIVGFGATFIWKLSLIFPTDFSKLESIDKVEQ